MKKFVNENLIKYNYKKNQATAALPPYDPAPKNVGKNPINGTMKKRAPQSARKSRNSFNRY